MSDEYLKDGTVVWVEFPTISFSAKIVGKAGCDMTDSYIVSCLDGTLPNKTCQYGVCIAPRMFFTVTSDPQLHTGREKIS